MQFTLLIMVLLDMLIINLEHLHVVMMLIFYTD